ncbi:uncharacterized protein J3D65DRAFT_2929 [Phyllosticta citribraziliensis]|uniref:Secreted protein n=1 Tax=Phyllosticta citribraziliensis TaxID=989973 RepID=A0ABR1M823_9PEZI
MLHFPLCLLPTLAWVVFALHIFQSGASPASPATDCRTDVVTDRQLTRPPARRLGPYRCGSGQRWSAWSRRPLPAARAPSVRRAR